MNKLIRILSVLAITLTCAPASAHLYGVWQFGWIVDNDGSVDLYAVSAQGLSEADDYLGNQLCFEVVCTNFDNVEALEGCTGARGVTGTCSPIWNALGLDGVNFGGDHSTGIYGKYAKTSFSAVDAGLQHGSNYRNLWSSSVDGEWFVNSAVQTYGVVDFVAEPPTGVPEPGSLALLAGGLLGASGIARYQTGRRGLRQA